MLDYQHVPISETYERFRQRFREAGGDMSVLRGYDRNPIGGMIAATRITDVPSEFFSSSFFTREGLGGKPVLLDLRESGKFPSEFEAVREYTRFKHVSGTLPGLLLFAATTTWAEACGVQGIPTQGRQIVAFTSQAYVNSQGGPPCMPCIDSAYGQKRLRLILRSAGIGRQTLILVTEPDP